MTKKRATFNNVVFGVDSDDNDCTKESPRCLFVYFRRKMMPLTIGKPFCQPLAIPR